MDQPGLWDRDLRDIRLAIQLGSSDCHDPPPQHPPGESHRGSPDRLAIEGKDPRDRQIDASGVKAIRMSANKAIFVLHHLRRAGQCRAD